METIENLRERLEALENQAQSFAKQMRATERRLHCWRRIAYGSLVVGLVSLPLASGITAQDESAEYRGIRGRVAALEYKLQYITGGPNEVVITGANLRIVNGLGSTDTVNGLGNLIVGYNEPRNEPSSPDVRTGSHNIVGGSESNFSSYGGLVVGLRNEIGGPFASASAGFNNAASGSFSSVSGGGSNTASGDFSSVSGGFNNTASGEASSISGGGNNTASGMEGASVSGGQSNTASGSFSSVSGGQNNTASGDFASVNGGIDNTASGISSSVNGGSDNTSSGGSSSVSGGVRNTASGISSSVSGGLNRTAPDTFNWAAGPLFAAQ